MRKISQIMARAFIYLPYKRVKAFYYKHDVVQVSNKGCSWMFKVVTTDVMLNDYLNFIT